MNATHPNGKSDTGKRQLDSYSHAHVDIVAFVGPDDELVIDAIADPTEMGGLAAARIAADDLDFEEIGALFDAEKFEGQAYADPNEEWIAQARVNLEREGVTALEFNGELLADDAEGDAHDFRVTTAVIR